MFENLKISEAEKQLLENIILELELEPDYLNNALAEIRFIINQLKLQSDQKTQEIVLKIFEIMPRLVQPAILMNDGILIVEQQSKQSDSVALIENAANQIIQATNNKPDELISSPNILRPRSLVAKVSKENRLTLRNSRTLIKKPENIIEEVLNALQEIQQLLLTKHQLLLVSPLQKLIDTYKSYLQKWHSAAASHEERNQLLTVKVEVQFKTTENNFYLMRQELARKVLCRDDYGFLRKSNSHGNHAVSISPSLVKKGSLTKGELDPILPGMEKIVVSFCNMLGQELSADYLAAPTTLIKLNTIVFQKINQKESDPSQWNNFNELYRSGKFTADSLIKQFPKLCIEPEEIDAFIQVGKTLHGWSLHDLLSLLQKIDQFRTVLGSEKMLENLPFFMSGSYVDYFIQANNQYADWLKNIDQTNPNHNLDAERVLSEQFNYLVNLLKQQAPAQRLKEFASVDFNQLNERKIDELKIEFNKVVQRYTPEQLTTAFVFLTYWPVLSSGQYFDDIVQITKLLKKIPELIPAASANEVLTELPRLSELFDHRNFTALIIGSLLINPCDGKADNYMAEFTRNEQGRITAIKIKGIDNDQALAHSIVRSETLVKANNPETGKTEYNKVEVHYAGVKCILYTLTGMMEKNVNQDVVKQFKSLNPELFLLSWLVEQYQDEIGYQKLTANIPSEFSIDIPCRFDPASVPLMLSKLKRLHQIFAGSEAITHQQLFYLMEPILSMFYQEMRDEQCYPLPTMSKIYHGGSGDCPTIEGVLQLKLDNYFIQLGNSSISLRQLLQTHNQNERYYKSRNQNIETVINDFIFKYLDLEQIVDNKELLWSILKLCSNFVFLKKLPLSEEKLHDLLFEAITRNESNVVSLLIQLDNVDVNTTKVIQGKLYTPLRFAVHQQKPCIPIINIFLKHKKIKPESFDLGGDTALSLAEPGNNELISVLIQNGIDIDTPHVKTGKTLIELAIENDKWTVFCNLIQYGAGKKLNAQQAFNFITSCYQYPERIESVRQAATILATQNSDFAWLLTLNAITQLNNADNNLYPVDVVIEQRIERRFIKSSVMSKLFTIENGVVKGIKKDNRYGRRAVAFVEHEGQKMHAKSHPEIFATEEGVKLLWRLLFSQGGIAESGVLRFFDQTGKPYPVLISRHIEGENLQNVVQDLSKMKAVGNAFDEQRFSEGLVMTMLTNPEDDKPDNKILRYFINQAGIKKLEIVGIDNDHAFVFPIVREEGHRILQVKTIIACFDQMREPLHPAVRKIILSLNPAELLKTWLEMLAKRQELYDQLFPEEERQRFFNNKEQPTLTRMPLPIGMTAHMFSTLITMQKVLKENPEIAQIDFLVKVEPSFVAYKYILDTVDNPGARFRMLFGNQYSELILDRFETKKTGKHILQSSNIPDKAMIANSIDYGPKQALKELQDTLHETQILQNVKQELLKGELQSFTKLLLSSSRQAILKDIVFKNLTTDLRIKILKSLKHVSLEYLDIHGCEDIDINLLKPIFENSPNILAIDISGCTKLKADALEIIAKNCEALKKLNLDELHWDAISLKDKPLGFPSLQQLSIRKCTNLRKISLKAPRLKKLIISDALMLEEIDIQGQTLKAISFDNCPKIPETAIYRLLGQSPELLKFMKFNGMSAISPRLLIWLNVAYGMQQWQPKNVEQMTKKGVFILQGTKANDSDINNITYFARRIEHINLIGAHLITWNSFAMLLERILTLQSIEKTDYHASVKTTCKLLEKATIEAFAPGFDSEVFSVGRDKLLRKHDLSNDKIHFVVAHDEPISTVLTINGLLFTGSTKGVLKIWDAATMVLIRTIKAHAANIKSLAYVAERNLLISVSEDKNIKYWDIYTGSALKTIANRTRLYGVEIMDNKLIVAAENGMLSIFNVLNGELLFTINAHQNPIFNIKKVSKDLFVTISGDYTAKIWDLNNRSCLMTLIGHSSSVTAVEVLQGGHLIATGSLDKTIKIWDIITGECINTIDIHNRKINALALVNNFLLSASDDETVYSFEFAIKHIPMDFVRRSEPFKILRQEALLRVLCSAKQKYILFDFIENLIVQVVGASGIGITRSLEQGEILFAINNKDKYFAVDSLLTRLNDFIRRCNLYETLPVNEDKSSLGSTQADSWASTSSNNLKEGVWTSAIPNTQGRTPKMFALQTRQRKWFAPTYPAYNNFAINVETADSGSNSSSILIMKNPGESSSPGLTK